MSLQKYISMFFNNRDEIEDWIHLQLVALSSNHALDQGSSTGVLRPTYRSYTCGQQLYQRLRTTALDWRLSCIKLLFYCMLKIWVLKSIYYHFWQVWSQRRRSENDKIAENKMSNFTKFALFGWGLILKRNSLINYFRLKATSLPPSKSWTN